MAFSPFTLLSVGALYLLSAIGLPGGSSRMPEPDTHLQPKATHTRVYIGSYTTKKKTGITLLDLNLNSGELTLKRVVSDGENPTYLVLSPDNRHLYAVNEIGNFNGQKSGAVSAFTIDPISGELNLLNQQPSIGDGPCHISMDKTRKYVFVANYGSGSVACLPIQPDGKLGPASAFIQHTGTSVDKQRQEGPHGHFIDVDSTNKFAFACDLGLDKILIYHFDPEKGTLTPADPAFATVPAGSGPRHLAFTPDNHFAYVCNEMKSTVSAFSYNGAGKLTLMETLSTLPSDFHGNNSTAEIECSADGKFLYVSNRGHNSIAIFAVDSKTGHLKPVGHQSTQGKTPRCFKLDPSGNFMLAANQDTDNVVSYRVDHKSGKLIPTGHSVTVSMPVCIQYAPVR